MDDDSWSDDGDTTTPCPYCNHPIYDDSCRCPHCGNYLSEEDVGSARKPWWIIAGVVLALLIIFFWIVG